MNHSHIAVAIVCGAALVAAAVFFSESPQPVAGVGSTVRSAPVDTTRLTDVSRADEPSNIYGNPDAPITIVEFSDFECPFCARLHPTLMQLVDESAGEIKWEFRHLPLASHARAQAAAEASECVATYGSNEAFWEFTDQLFTTMNHAEGEYRRLAASLAVDMAAYDACVADREMEARVLADLATAQRLGGRGTPFSIIVFADGRTIPVPGALPYEQWQTLLQR